MRKERISPSISYLIELVVAILFFATACVICVNIFYQASNSSSRNEARILANFEAQAIAENAIASNQRVTCGSWYTDEKWSLIEGKSDYRVSIRERALDDHLYVYELQMRKHGEILIKLEFTVLDKGGTS